MHASKSAATVSGMLAEDTRFLGQRQRTVIHSTASSVSFMFELLSLALQLPQGDAKVGPGGC